MKLEQLTTLDLDFGLFFGHSKILHNYKSHRKWLAYKKFFSYFGFATN
ncbi:MAG: hypothetical protein ACI9Y1_001521 [Lentisphaeria bacterium]|jgi:hypothetical protein